MWTVYNFPAWSLSAAKSSPQATDNLKLTMIATTGSFSTVFRALQKCFLSKEWQIMRDKEIERLYEILEKLTDQDEKAALRHAIFILESQA